MADPCWRVMAIVVTQDRLGDLKDCIEALLHQTVPLDSVLVIDNAGPNDLDALLPKDPRLTIHRHPINSGGAGGFHRGLMEGLQRAADAFWLLDDDAIPRPEALEALLVHQGLIKAGRAPILLSAVYEYGGLALRHRRQFSPRLGFEWAVPLSDYQRASIPVDTGSFVGFLLPREAALAIPLPRADFFLAFDDTEYSLRLKAEGFELLLIPASGVDHRRGIGARLRAGPFSVKHALNIRNHLYIKRHFVSFQAWGTLIGILYGFLIFLRCGGFRSFRALKALLQSLQDGIRGRLGPPRMTFLRVLEAEHKGLCILIRTQGVRLELLREAVASALTQEAIHAVWVLVHGDQEAYGKVLEALQGIAGAVLEVIWVPGALGQRAHPLNVALRRLYEAKDLPLGLAFLDEDDRLYPNFSGVLLKALERSGADLIYAQSVAKAPDGALAPGYSPLPAPCLLVRNFMPINSFIVRVSSLKRNRVFFDEALLVTEDWGFLQRLLALGFVFEPVFGVYSEFLLGGDGNQPVKKEPGLWDQAWERLHEEQRLLWPSLNAQALLDDFLRFNFKARAPLSEAESGWIRETLQKMAAAWPWLLQDQGFLKLLEGSS